MAILYPAETAQIAAIDVNRGTIRKICEVKGAGLFYVTSLAFDPATHTLFYTEDNTAWRDIRAINVKTGKSRLILKDERIGDLVFNRQDSSLWGVRHYNGISTLVRIPHPYREWNQIYSWPYGRDLYDIDISPDGKYLSGALAEINGQQLLIQMPVDSLMAGNPVYEVLFNFENSLPANFIYSTDGNYLYGSSYYSGVSNIFRYDRRNGEILPLSNCETGFFRPIEFSKDSLIVFRYTGKGFVPGMITNFPVSNVSAIKFLGNEIVKKHPVVKEWILDSPRNVQWDSLQITTGPYHPVRNIGLSSAYPVVAGYKDVAAFGLRLNFLDPLGVAGMDLSVAYSPHQFLKEDERLHLKFNSYYWYWKIFATYNQADFYDLFGPTKISRKGFSLGLQYQRSLFYEKPRVLDLTIRLAGYGGLERLPDFQNVAASFDKFATLRGKLSYSYLQRTLGAVAEEKGVQLYLTSKNNYVNNQLFPLLVSGADIGLLLPLPHSSVWLRTAFAWSFGEREEPFANFFFGGFGNNWVDHQGIKRFREYSSFPGIEINAAGGLNFGKALLEWTLPPLRFRRVGTPSFYLRWAQLSVFSSGLVTNFDYEFYRQTLYNLGGQLDFRLVTFSHLNSTFSLGYAAAFEKNNKISTEFMISLKIL